MPPVALYTALHLLPTLFKSILIQPGQASGLYLSKSKQLTEEVVPKHPVLCLGEKRAPKALSLQP